jgi:uncharacterized protein (DUF924 family)
MSRVEEILEYWFGTSPDDLQVLAQKGKLWFGKDEQVDAEIRQRFGALITSVGQQGLLDGPESEAFRYLATILLLDQFTRNVFRGERRAFASDPLALQLALAALQCEHDLVLRPIERVFIYLPLEHSEDLPLQNRSVELFQGLLDAVPAAGKKAFAGFLDYAVRHQEIIARFGRFPHRNAILGRESSAAELEFLNQPNSSF